MRLGMVDLGSNSCRLKIMQWEANAHTTLYESLRTTRLMKGVAQNGKLRADTMQNTLQALREFRQKLEEWQVGALRMIATSAMREAVNGAEFATRIEQEIGCTVDIISGEEEARLSYTGMKMNLPQFPAPLLLDVGGGSSELYYPQIVQLSLPMGAVRATEESLTAERALTLLQPLQAVREALAACTLVGCGGTITTLAAIFHQMQVYDKERIQGSCLQYAQIEAIWQKLAAMNLESRCHLPGLQPQRADVIVAGVFWVLQIMKCLHKNELVVSDADLMDAVLYELYQQKNREIKAGAV